MRNSTLRSKKNMQQNEIREKKWNAAIYVRISEEEKNKELRKH